MVLSKYPDIAEFHEISTEDILILCRNYIHKGAVLINHPLSGSIKLDTNPYKSIVISDPKLKLDFQSLQLIENALAAVKKSDINAWCKNNKRVLEDYQLIDLELLNSAINALPSEYY